MKKKIKLILLISLVTFLIGITPSYADSSNVQNIDCRNIQLEIDNKNVLVNEKAIDPLETAPYIKGGFTLVPIRFISESLQFNVKWDAENQKVIITNNDTNIILSINSNIAIVNNIPKQLDAPAEITNGKTMVPLRFISETFKAKVDWNGEKRKINITSKSCVILNNVGNTISIEDTIHSVLTNSFDAMNKHDVQSYLNTIDPVNPSYNTDWKSNFERNKDMVFTFINSKVLNTTDDKLTAQLEYTIKYRDATIGNVTIKVSDAYVFHKGNDGFWRIFGGTETDQYKSEVIPNE
jgi:hypothetical protein